MNLRRSPNLRNHRPTHRRHKVRHRLPLPSQRLKPLPPQIKIRKSKAATGSQGKTHDISRCSSPAASTKRRSSTLSTNSELSDARLIIRPGKMVVHGIHWYMAALPLAVPRIRPCVTYREVCAAIILESAVSAKSIPRSAPPLEATDYGKITAKHHRPALSMRNTTSST